jgi:glycosyltransferase involved in cell wall biosynthesis
VQGKPVRILIYAHAFAPEVGGVETIVSSLARRLVGPHPDETAKIPETTLVTATPGGGVDDTALGFRVVRQPGLGKLLKLFQEAEVIHLAGPALLPLFLGWLMRKRIVVEHHGFQTVCPNGQLFYERDQCLCPGHFMAARHLECLRCNVKCGRITSFKMWLLTFPRRRLCEMISANVTPTVWLSTVLRLPRTTCIPHGLPLAANSQTSEDLFKPPTFVFMGRLVGTKGAEILIGAAQKLKEQGCVFRVRIIGNGPDRGILQQKAVLGGLSGCMEFLGYLPDGRVQEALAGAVAVVMPSLAGEVFGLVAAENMLCGRLVIASDIGPLREVVGEAGLLFPPGDEIALMHCMRQVLEDASGASALRKKAKERAGLLFDEALMVRDHLALYRRLVPCEE